MRKFSLPRTRTTIVKSLSLLRTRNRLAVLLIVITASSAAALTATSAANLVSSSVNALLFADTAQNATSEQHKTGMAMPSYLSSAASSLIQTSTGATLNTARQGHTATLLNNGNILITGGDPAGSAEIFNASQGTSSATGSLSVVRSAHTATKLADGRVLVMGGRDANGVALASTEIYNPANGTFSNGPSMGAARASHTATALADGRILIAGGDAAGSAEIYDPSASSPANSFSFVNGTMNASRSGHSAALLNDGRVLLAGGEDAADNELHSAEIFNPATHTFVPTGNEMAHHRVRPLLRVLPDVRLADGAVQPGKVQIIGGNDDLSMEVYDPAIDTIGAHGHLIPVNDEHAALMQDDILRSPSRAALFHNGQADALLDREHHSITEITNQALVAGGVNTGGQTLNSFSVLNSSNATVTTDKLDYQPGQTAIIIGTGWQAGETVNIILHEDPHTHTERRLTATADANGNFTANYLVEWHDAYVTFIIGAKGQTSGRTAQTTFTDVPSDPTPQTIPYSQDFSGLAHNSNVYPAGWQGWTLATASSTSFRTNSPTDNEALQANRAANNTNTGVSNYNGKIGILAGGTSTTDPALALALNTTGYSSINITFDIMTIRNPHNVSTNTRINQADLQYRICPALPTVCTGSFATVSGNANGIYENNTTNQTGNGVTTPQKTENKNFTLPAAADNQPNVQIRWVQRDFSGGGLRPSFAVDNISVTAAPSCTAPTVTTHPMIQTKNVGESVTFSVGASGTAPLNYQWRKNTVAISGATSSSYTISSVVTGDAGSYDVVVTNSCGSATSNAAILTVNKATPTITWNNPADITYGTALSATQLNATASVPGSFVYTPAAGAVLNAGNAQNLHVDFTPNDTANYNTALKDVSINVLKATPTVMVTGGTFTYDGNSHAASATATGIGSATVNGTFAFTYTPPGDATAPVNASATPYSVSANFTSTDLNYGNAVGNGSITINQAGSMTTVTVNSATYDGNQHGGTAVATGAGNLNQSLTVTYEGRNGTSYGPNSTAPTNAGDYRASASFAGDTNHTGSNDSKDFSIAKATPTVAFTSTAPSQLAFGGTYTPTATHNGDGTLTIGASGSCSISGGVVTMTSGIGTCTVTASVSEGANYLSGSAAPQMITAIKANQTITFTGAPASAIYNTTFNVSASASSMLPVTITRSGVCSISGLTVTMTSGTGTCTLTASQSGNDNYNRASDVMQMTNAEKAAANFVLSDLTQTYDGNPRSATVNVTPPGLAYTVTYVGVAPTVYSASMTPPTNAGTYSVTATVAAPDSNNYQGSSTQPFTINRKPTSVIGLSPQTLTYGNAIAQTATVSGGPGGETIAYTLASGLNATTGFNGYSNPVNVGDYTLKASYAGNSNYEGSEATANVTINKADQTITWTNPAAITYGTALSATQLNATVAGVTGGSALGALTYNPVVGTVLAAGNHTLSVTAAATANYNAANKDVALTVSPANTATDAPNKMATFGDASVMLTASVANTSTSAAVNEGTVTFTVKQGMTTIGTVTSVTVSGGAASASFNLSGVAAGPYQICATYNPGSNFNGSSDATPATLTVSALQTMLTIATPANTQYSDPVTLSASVSPATLNGQNQAGSVEFFINNVSVGSATVSGGVATLSGVPNFRAPGNYNVTAIFTSTNPNFTSAVATNGNSKTLTVTQEDATATYSGATYFATSSPTSKTANLTLSATVVDDSDGSRGDIRNAKVEFRSGSPTGLLLGTANVGLVDPLDSTVGTATLTNITYTLSNGEFDNKGTSFDVYVVVTNYYTNASTVQTTVTPITVAVPGTDSVTGGGHLVLQLSNGIYAGDNGSKMNLGYTMKYNNNGRNLKGQANIIVRRMVDGVQRIYQIKSNAVDSLATPVNNVAGTATFTTKANMKDITNPLAPIDLGGNLRLQIDMTDAGTGGQSDKVGITLWNADGGLYFSSRWNGTRTDQQLLGGGNVSVLKAQP